MRVTPSPATRRILGHVFAVCSGVVVVAFIGWSVYLLAHKDLLLTFTPAQKTTGTLIMGVAMGMVLAMWGWMLVDCAVHMARERNSYLVGWLVVMVLLYPAAWAYYLLEWRRRGRRGEA